MYYLIIIVPPDMKERSKLLNSIPNRVFSNIDSYELGDPIMFDLITTYLFKFDYPPQKSPIIEIPILKNNHQDYINTFLSFLQKDFEIDEKIGNLLKNINEELQKWFIT